MDDKETTYLIEEMTKDYHVIWDKLGFIKEDHAHARAANGIMVGLEKQKDYVKGYIDSQRSTTTEPPKVQEVLAKPTEPSTVPTPIPTPQPPMPAPSEDTKQLGFDGKVLPAYDRSGLKWIRCPVCASVDIDIWSEKKQRYFQGCFDCQIWLIPDGKTRPMGEKPMGVKE